MAPSPQSPEPTRDAPQGPPKAPSKPAGAPRPPKAPTAPRKGRKSKYSAAITNRICTALAAGAPIQFACQYGPIAESTFHEWMKTNPEFSERIDEVRSQYVVRNLLLIQREADNGDWRAAEAKLRLSYPKIFGKQINTDQHITVDNTAAAQELAALIEKEVPDPDARFRLALKLVEGGSGSATPATGTTGD